jgi:hypothetical protein
MSTIILFWNPDISSYSMERHHSLLADDMSELDTFNWSVWEHERAHEGDLFFMVRCKNRPVPGKLNRWGKQLWEPVIDDTTGICMAGEFISEPYCGEDWSGKGRETFYMDMSIRQASDPDKFVILKSADLLEEIPNFDWKGGHSGRLLAQADAARLKKLFEASRKANSDKIWTPKYLL